MWSTKGNPNLFSHFFYPYISLNLEKYVIPSNSYSSVEPFIHPYVVKIVFSTFFIFLVLSLSMCFLHLIPFFILPLLVCLLHLIPLSFLPLLMFLVHLIIN
jgi:hypothetical protein